MDQSKLKSYARKARREFIVAVTDRAAFYGLTASGIEPVVEQGDVALIGERPFPLDIAAKHKSLAKRVRRAGFEQAMEAMAYTWFNRFAAIRYMELHGYLDHGYRVLSHPEGREQPEILDHAADVNLPGLDQEKVVELMLEGSQDEALYQFLLKAQCNALHQAMPFLFERIGDATELLLPPNLLHTDSLIRRLVGGIDESAWDEIEIIGWLYQFYISEKKEQVIGKVLKSEDIPAATQLFTPNWIVKYLVQNSLGAQWLATYPYSPLKGQMGYYIEAAEQTDEVKAQLAAITPDTLNPEAVTLIDPACGSGHILVEAYALFKAIYLERGYRQRDVPRLVLEKNLFGLDIDARAAQLAGFSLMMKGRADDWRIFEKGVKLNVMAFVDSAGIDAERLAQVVKLSDYGLQLSDLSELRQLFEHATTFGSLIEVPERLVAKLSSLKQLSEITSQDLFLSDALKRLGRLVWQAEVLVAQYDGVVANPPYMGGKGMNTRVKKFAKDHFADAKSDLFACFIERGYTLAKSAGHNAMVTMQSWMFLSSFQKMRERMLREKTIGTMAHLGARAFGSISGEVVQTTAFVLKNSLVGSYKPTFFRLLEGDETEKQVALASGAERFNITAQDEFKTIPGSPMAYWVSRAFRRAFSEFDCLEDFALFRQGMSTTAADRFEREWAEIDCRLFNTERTEPLLENDPPAYWYPFNKGGAKRRWYGNLAAVVRYEKNGQDLLDLVTAKYPNISDPEFVIKNRKYFFRAAVTYATLGSGAFYSRLVPTGCAYSVAGPAIFSEDWDAASLVSILCSSTTTLFLSAINPTLGYQITDVGKLPVSMQMLSAVSQATESIANVAVSISKTDWNAYERSWDFQSLPILTASSDAIPTLQDGYTAWITQNRKTIAEMQRLEEENNRLFIDAYGLTHELAPEVPIEQITLTVNPAYRYGSAVTEEERWTRFRRDTMAELVSYAIGCMMGRYSLDAPGLIYAHSGNTGFAPSRYTTFPADSDGLVPLTDNEWFEDDAAQRLIEFISVAWDADHLEDNLMFLADNLKPRKSESSRDTIRRYLCDSFFKNHLQTYRNRPIYWLFSSGSNKVFQCLVYLHRYNEGTLARMRTEYAVPLQGMMASRERQLDGDIDSAVSSAHRRRLEKERSTLVKQQIELRDFDEKLRHYADTRISLDLDDGVKVNYGKFGDLLAEVKKVVGKKAV